MQVSYLNNKTYFWLVVEEQIFSEFDKNVPSIYNEFKYFDYGCIMVWVNNTFRIVDSYPNLNKICYYE